MLPSSTMHELHDPVSAQSYTIVFAVACQFDVRHLVFALNGSVLRFMSTDETNSITMCVLIKKFYIL